MNKQNRNRLRYREQTDNCQMEGHGELGEKVKVLRSTNWQLEYSYGDVKYSIGSIVNNIVITVYGAM